MWYFNDGTWSYKLHYKFKCSFVSDNKRFGVFWCASNSTTYPSKLFHHPHNHSDKDRTWSSSGGCCTLLADGMAVSNRHHRNLSQPHKIALIFQRDNDKTLQERCPELMRFPAMSPQARNIHHLRRSDKDGWTEIGLSWRFLYLVPRMSGKSVKIFLNLNPTENRFKPLVCLLSQGRHVDELDKGFWLFENIISSNMLKITLL